MQTAGGSGPNSSTHTFGAAHAVLVGVGADLPNTVDDAIGIGAVLGDPGRCGYPPEQVACLTAEDATRDGVLRALAQLDGRVTDDSMVIFYFSGHGYQQKTAEGDRFWLMPYGHSVADLPKTAISGAEVTAALKDLRAKCLLVLLDCCHAGGLEDAKAADPEIARAAIPVDAQAILAAGRGRAVIASSRATELSYAGKPYSAFTAAILEALCGKGAAVKDGFVRLADLALYAASAVPGKTKDRQHPVLDFKKADNFPVAWYAGGDAAPKALPFDSLEIEDEPGAMFDLRGQHVANQVNLGPGARVDFLNVGWKVGQVNPQAPQEPR